MAGAACRAQAWIAAFMPAATIGAAIASACRIRSRLLMVSADGHFGDGW